MVQIDLDLRFRQPVLERLLGHMRFKVPGDRLVVFLADAFIELTRDASDGFLFAVVGVAEAAGGHAADEAAGLDEGDVEALACGGYGGCYAS